jgi:hypothetical protein
MAGTVLPSALADAVRAGSFSEEQACDIAAFLERLCTDLSSGRLTMADCLSAVDREAARWASVIKAAAVRAAGGQALS